MTSGNRPAPEQGSWQLPGAAGAYQPPDEVAAGETRGRPGLVALTVALVELAVIAAAGNQAVTKHAVRYAADHPGFLGHVVASSLQFAWRVTPQAGAQRRYTGELVTIGVLVVLSALLAAVVVRGAVTFWRAFFGIWTAAVAASCVARAAGAFGTAPAPSGTDAATNAVFDAVTAETVFAGAVLGLLAGLIAAFVARATRRTLDRPAVAPTQPEPAYVPENPPPFYGNAPTHPSAPAHPSGHDAADDRTTQLPRVDPGGQQWPTPASDGETTRAMPVDTDDDRRG